MSKPLVRVTQLEAYRRYIEQSDYASYEITEQSVIDNITGAFVGNEYTRIGTAFHSIVESGAPRCVKIPAGERTFLYYGKPVSEAVPAGREFDVEDVKVRFDIPQCEVALNYRNEHPDAIHEYRMFKDYGDAIVTGQMDMIDGLEIRDIKTKYSQPSDVDYINSCQSHFYMDMTELDKFSYDLFIFEEYKIEKHGTDVRGLCLRRHEPITVYSYSGMEQDNAYLIKSFLEWAAFRGLTEYLINQNKKYEQWQTKSQVIF